MAKRLDPAKSKRTERLDELMKRADIVAENIRQSIKNMNVDSDEFRSLVDENRRLSDDCGVLLAEMPDENAEPSVEPSSDE